MILASALDDLERLTGLGFPPFMALLIVFLMILGMVIGGGFLFFWKQLARERERQDAIREEIDEERAEWHTQVEDRLQSSERQHADCQEDRQALRTDLDHVKIDLERMRRCPKADCPMRLPS